MTANKTYQCRCCLLSADLIAVHEVQRPPTAQVDTLHRLVAAEDHALPGCISCLQSDTDPGAAGPCGPAGSCLHIHPMGKLLVPQLQNVIRQMIQVRPSCCRKYSAAEIIVILLLLWYSSMSSLIRCPGWGSLRPRPIVTVGLYSSDIWRMLNGAFPYTTRGDSVGISRLTLLCPTRMMGLHDGEDRLLLVGFISPQYQCVMCDRQTDIKICLSSNLIT